MINMTDTLADFLSTVSPTDDYGSGSGTGDYDFDSPCDKSIVRRFRMYYEPPLYLLIVTLGFAGNLLVLWIYKHFKNRLKTMTDVYLLNLALADLLFLCTLPLWAVDAMKGWAFGTALCKSTSAVYKINFFSSMFLLTCISVDRYVSIVQSTKAQNSKELRLTCSKVVCVFVWLLSIILSIPEFLFARTKVDPDGNHFCTMVYWNNENNHTKILVLALQISMGFCIPLLVMIYCYSVIIRTLLKAKNFEKHKALRVILAVVTVFILSQLPYNSLLVVEATQAANTTITDCAEAQGFDIATQVMKSLAYMHSCLNPFLYAFIGVRFRKDLKRLYRKYGCTTSKSGKHGGPLRSSVMSDTDSTMAFSL
ncbi:C-C chemokine receptor type 9a [Ictalurus furcatus]|uniref:C-C chemokine receptor type 9a n=1 Tax=Ictalurus furcatus TaxID=66913 RepID=UPI00235094B8|nr:C-C chemokine receptor type 9a [Ictalurus furcatus]XP_053484031.1 C-C chemokine receptor type 9a [Ictalurus furcatus]